MDFADLFAGAGGATTGVLLAARRLRLPVGYGVAINHWPKAVATHAANHPGIHHLCESIERVDPTVAVPSGRLDLLWASPECTHHSVARGGRPRQDQSRAGANHVLSWLDKLYVRSVIIENVPEFADWGPLSPAGKPLPSRKGASFAAFLASLEARNYQVDWRILNAADYGDATTRRRLFIVARRRPARVRWPEPTHRPPGATLDLLGTAAPYRAAKEIIDWSLPSASIYERRRALSPKTLARIEAGLRRYGLGPFLVSLEHGSRLCPVDAPLNTITTAKGGAHALIEPLLLPQHGGGQLRPVSRPVPTIACDGAIGLVEPFLVKYFGTATTQSVAEPLHTVTAKPRFGLAQPLVQVEGQTYRLDVRFRMLQPHELAAAQGFPKHYRFLGTKTEVVKQIGNANPVNLTAALSEVVLAS